MQPLLLLHGRLLIMSQHAFLCIYNARTALQALRGCLRWSHPQSMLLASFPAWRCVLVLRFCTWHVLSILPCCSLPFSHCCTLLLLCPCPSAQCSQLFADGPDSIMWQLLFGQKYARLPQPKAEDNAFFLVQCMEAGTEVKKAVTKWDMKGDMAFLQCFSFLIAATPGTRTEGLVCGDAIAANEHVMSQAEK